MTAKHEAILQSLHDSIPPIFDQAQLSTANHRKNCVALHKLQTKAASVTHAAQQGTAVKLTGERVFGDVFIDMVNRVLVIKKGSAPADRIVKFIGAYVNFVLHHSAEKKSKTQASIAPQPSADDEDTPTSRFTSRLLTYMLKGFEAKEKTVRYRCVNIVAELISHLGELDEDIYGTLREKLMQRVHDKESVIRTHAIVALSKLLGGEDPTELTDGEASITDTIIECLCYDPAPEVRRISLLSVPLTAKTLPAILTRTRDTDPVVRSILYAVVLLPAPVPSASVVRATRLPATSPTRLSHPRQLTIAQRERILRDGLGDREDKVRAAAGKMLAAWFDGASEEAHTKGAEGNGVIESVIEFLKLFDVVGLEGRDIAADALASVFLTRPHVLDSVTFHDKYWVTLSPESALLARVFIEHTLSTSPESSLLEAAALPVVTAFAFYVQEACNALLDAMESLEEARLAAGEESDDEHSENSLDKHEEQVVERVFILGEMLQISTRLDFSDEIGRRKMFSVVRDMLAHELLPESLMELCLDVLKETTPSERDIIRIVVEVINELRDGVNDIEADGDQTRALSDTMDITQDTMRSRISKRNKLPQEMTPEERAQADEMDARCLSLCIATLKCVNGTFDENSTLEGVLADLIIPAVKRRELALRTRGLISLGLCCLISKNLAMNSFQLFLNQVHSAPENLKIKVLEVIFDVLMVYDEELLQRSEEVTERILTFLLQTLEVEESDAVQAVLCIGISKLMLNGLVKDERVLTSLVLAYVSPVTAENQELRQCLAYFLPIYCYSSPLNQSRMQSIFLTAYDLVTRVHEELVDDQEMITPSQFCTLFIDWTNPQKAATADVTGIPTRDVHVDLAVDILQAMYDRERSESDRRVLCQTLTKLYLPEDPEPLSLLMLNVLLENLQDRCPFEDAATEKMIHRFESQFKKMYSKKVGKLDINRYVTEPRFREVCQLAGEEIAEYDEEVEEGSEEEQGAEEAEKSASPTPKRGQKRKKTSPASPPASSEDEMSGGSVTFRRSPSTAPDARKKNGKGRPTDRRAMSRRAASPESIDLNKENTASSPSPSMVVTTTPKRERVAKRTRSPGMLSPVHKRTNRQETPRKRAGRASSDPLVDATNDRRQRKLASARNNNRAARTLQADGSSEDSDSGPNDDFAGDISEEDGGGHAPRRSRAPSLNYSSED